MVHTTYKLETYLSIITSHPGQLSLVIPGEYQPQGGDALRQGSSYWVRFNVPLDTV